MHGPAGVGFRQVDHRVKPVRRLLPEMPLQLPAAGRFDHALDLVDVPVEQVDLSGGGLYPCSAIDPWPPLVQRRHRGDFGGRKAINERAHGDNGERPALGIVHAEIDVRIRSCRPAGVRAAEGDGLDSGHTSHFLD